MQESKLCRHLDLHWLRSCAIWYHLHVLSLILNFFRSFLTLSLHLIFVPWAGHRCGSQPNSSCFGNRLLSILATCPSQRSLWAVIRSSNDSTIPNFFLTCMLVICSILYLAVVMPQCGNGFRKGTLAMFSVFTFTLASTILELKGFHSPPAARHASVIWGSNTIATPSFRSALSFTLPAQAGVVQNVGLCSLLHVHVCCKLLAQNTWSH